MSVLLTAARERGTTVILVTHDARVAAYADREVVVRDGKVSTLTGAQAMISLGLRLVLSGGREAVIRFLVLATAVGLGVGLLLTAVAATHAVTTWNNRHAWLWTGTASVPAGPAAGIAPLWWHPSGDTFDGQQINRFDVAATGTSSPVPPGIPRDPGPGQYYASPALAALLRSHPGGPAGRPLPRPPGRHDRRRRAAVAGLAGHHRRAHPGAAGGHTGQRAGDVDRHGGARERSAGPGEP